MRTWGSWGPRRKTLGALLRLMVIALPVLAGLLGAANFFFPFPLPPVHSGSGTVIAARDGTPLRAFADDRGIWRYPTDLEQVSPLYLQALINYEDRFYWRHPGVNPISLVRAAWQWAASGDIVSGGSTLTMQVARILEPHPKTMAGKTRQILRALQLTLRHDKTDILNYYLNHAPFGGTIEGVRAAAFTYLGKSATELSRGDAALLAVLPQAPTRLRPDLHPDAALRARNKVLDRLARLGVWSKNEIAQAKLEPIPTRSFQSPMTAPLLARRLRKSIPPGTVARTTIDAHLQEALEQRLAQFSANLPERTSVAILVVENQSLAVRAYVGSVDFFDSERFGHVDMVRAIRSPGSTLKPFLYGFALGDGLIHSASLLTDAPISFDGYQPSNFTSGYMGPVTASEALCRSLNVPAVQLLEKLTPEVFFARLNQGGLRLYLPKHARPNLSMILGGAGVRLESLVAAYTAFARKGLSGTLRFLEAAPVKKRFMMSEPAAWVVRDILENNPRPGYRNQNIAFPQYRKVAWKTGTSYGFRDAWAIGVNDRNTVGVWVGRPDGTPVPGHYGAITAAPILFSIFDMLPDTATTSPSLRPENVTKTDICWPLGLQPNPENKDLCHVRHEAWVIDHIIPPTFPDRNQKTWQSPMTTIYINPKNGSQVQPGCAVKNPEIRQIPRWPLALEPWLPYRIRKLATLPPMDPQCKTTTPIHPQTLKLTGLSSQSLLRRAGKDGVSPMVTLSVLGAFQQVYWIINGELKQKSTPKQTFAYRFNTPGHYEITALDASGSFDRVDIQVMD